MVCTWFHAPTSQCCNAYCHYSRNETIVCPIKKEWIKEAGDYYKESFSSDPMNGQQQRRYPKQY